jgi:putative DNA primase/helicase
MRAAEIALALPKGRKAGNEYVACCPAHKDTNPSLSIRDTDDGQVLVHCHAGCAQAAVIAALKALGLWPTGECNLKHTIIAEYDYTDEAGTMLYQVVRYQPKDFRPRYPDGAGGWVYRKHPRQVLYHLPEVLKNTVVFVVEGEKDADKLREYGFVATTNAGGAKAPWLPAYTEALRGCEVILIPDNDPPGRSRVLTTARALLGHAAQVIVLTLEGTKDVSDWFDQGHSELELIYQIEAEHAL